MDMVKKADRRAFRSADVFEHGRRFAPRRAGVRQNSSRSVHSANEATSSVAQRVQTHKSQPHYQTDITTPIRTSMSTKPSRTVAAVKPALPRLDRSRVLRRQIVEKASQYQQKARKHQLKRLKIYAGVSVFVVFAALIGIQNLPFGGSGAVDSSGVSSGTLAATDRRSTAELDESPVTLSQINAHIVSSELPRLVTISRLGLQSRVVEVGRDMLGEPVYPVNINDVGWIKTTPAPGDAGAAIFNGSVVGPTKEGVFRNLGRVAAGDIIEVEMGDGTIKRFSVVAIEQYDSDKVDYAALSDSADPTRPGLNLLAMQGRFNVRENKFEKRVAVFSILVD